MARYVSGKHTSIRYSERIATAGITPSVGAVGSSYDNALAESINGLYKTELIKPRAPWRTLDAVEIATAEWVDWFNHRRLYEFCGDIPPADLEALVGPVDLWAGAVRAGDRQAAPGMAERHYAPRARLQLVAPGSGLRETLRGAPGSVAYVAFGTLPPLPPGVRGILLPLAADLVGARLYALLHELDDAGCERIFMERPPEDEAWLAVRDRLRRASAKERP